MSRSPCNSPSRLQVVRPVVQISVPSMWRCLMSSARFVTNLKNSLPVFECPRIVCPLAEKILLGDITDGDHVEVSSGSDRLVFSTGKGPKPDEGTDEAA